MTVKEEIEIMHSVQEVGLSRGETVNLPGDRPAGG